jgi:hypothetical protein
LKKAACVYGLLIFYLHNFYKKSPLEWYCQKRLPCIVTLDEYRLITDTFTQLQQLWIKGCQVDCRVDGTSTFLLFQLKDFYVEIEYEKVKKKFLGIKTFQDGILLDTYISNIDLSTLLTE